MIESASIATHINEFSTITTQLSLVEIEFDDEVRALIFVSSLPKSWNAIVTTMSNSFAKKKMVFKDIQDLILSKEIHQRELRETSSSTLNIESRGRHNDRNSNQSRLKSRQSKSRSRKEENSCWNCGKTYH